MDRITRLTGKQLFIAARLQQSKAVHVHLPPALDKIKNLSEKSVVSPGPPIRHREFLDRYQKDDELSFVMRTTKFTFSFPGKCYCTSVIKSSMLPSRVYLRLSADLPEALCHTPL